MSHTVQPDPNVDIARSAGLQALWEEVADKVQTSGGWSVSDQVDILIIPGNRIKTAWKRSGPRPGKPHAAGQAGAHAAPLEYSEIQIQIGADLFVDPQGFGTRLVNIGVAPDVAAFHFLAHETFHLTEAERMRKCGITVINSHSLFALAIFPEMDLPWKAAVSKLANEYSKYENALAGSTLTMDIHIRRARDIASEACADVLGLALMQKAELDWLAFLPALISLRTQDEVNPLNYQIGAALATLTAPFVNLGKVPGKQEIIGLTWQMAFFEIAQSPTLDPILKAEIQALPNPLLFPEPKKPRFRFPGFGRS